METSIPLTTDTRKDWQGFESRVRRVLGTREAAALLPVLADFDAYLDALFGHVRRRAVLLNHADEAQ